MLIMGSTPPVSWDKSCPTFLKSLVMSSCRDITSRVVMAMSAAMATSAVVMATTWFMWSVRVVAVCVVVQEGSCLVESCAMVLLQCPLLVLLLLGPCRTMVLGGAMAVLLLQLDAGCKFLCRLKFALSEQL